MKRYEIAALLIVLGTVLVWAGGLSGQPTVTENAQGPTTTAYTTVSVPVPVWLEEAIVIQEPATTWTTTTTITIGELTTYLVFPEGATITYTIQSITFYATITLPIPEIPTYALGIISALAVGFVAALRKIKSI